MPDELTSDDVQHVAALARIGATPEELERMRSQLSQILEVFQILQELNTEGVEPTGHAIALQNVLREDEIYPSTPHDDILANAPREEDGYFRVKAVLE